MIFLPTIILLTTALWPNPTVDYGTSKWVRYGHFAVGLMQAQPECTRRFLSCCTFNGKTLSPALGLNWHFGNLTAGHVSGLRQLLLIAGDVESNPGPTDTQERPGASTQSRTDVQEEPGTSSQSRTDLLQATTMKCQDCNQTFTRPGDLQRHYLEQHNQQRPYECDRCEYRAKRPAHLARHKRTRHANEPYPVPMKVQMPQPQPLNQEAYTATELTALGSRLRSYRVTTDEMDPMTFLNNLIPQIDNYISKGLEEHTGLKLQLVTCIEFFKPTDPKEEERTIFYSQQLPIFRGSDYDITETFQKIMELVDRYTKKGSGWVIKSIKHADIHLIKYEPMRGSSDNEIPKELKAKGAIINIKNKDEKCFMWSILAALYPTTGQHDNPNRVTNYRKHENKLDFTGVSFPVQLKDIKKFERQNNLAVNIYSYEDDIFPLRISDVKDCRHVHLLLYEGHYSLIKDLNKLLHDKRKDGRRKFFCPRCLIPKTRQDILDDHLKLCSTMEPTKVKMPEETTLKFQNYHKMLRQPLVVYADFECLTVPADHQRGSTHQYQHHMPSGYGLVESFGCCGAPKFKKPTICREDKVVEKFLIDLVGIANEHQKRINNKASLDYNSVDASNNMCHICGEKIYRKKVQDHCHICGRYRGPAHNECNQAYRLNRDIVVVFHNLRRYDGHLIMQEIGQIAKLMGLKIEVIAKAMEDYISFSLGQKKDPSESGCSANPSYKIRFIDSQQFLNCSLEGLVSNLEASNFRALGKFHKGERLALLRRKGVYPYDYMDSVERFKEHKLPTIEAFYSQLNDENIKQEDYNHAQRVWETFGIKNMGQFHDLYLESDVLLLADVFEEFRRLALEKYELDPCHYVTAPSLTWDACLWKTRVKLELFNDTDMYMLCERGIRGGVSQISHRYARANNSQVPGYDPTKPNTYIPYLDANNLYGYAMSQKLPVDGFRWMTEEEIVTTDLSKVDGDTGYILEVDLDYPQELHDIHSDYPLAPEPMEITSVSPYSEHLKETLGLRIPPQTKLVPNLFNKKNYILHCRNLKLYRDLGLVLTKVHRVLKFNQRAWLAEYIDLNTKMRAQARNDFEKDLFKLMNNAVFGKTMENVRRYRDIELVNNPMRLEKLAANPRFNSSCRFNEDLVGVSMLKASCTLCKPIYIGISVLDLSKELMYQFHYEHIVPQYGSKAKLLFTDTDSLCYHIETNDIYKDMLEHTHMYDFSEYPKDHPNFSDVNKKVIGKMKDETKSKPIWAFCGLRPKMYGMEGEGLEKKRAKGIKKGVVKKNIKFQDYVDTLFSEQSMQHSMNLIRSHKHELFSEKLTKKSLSPYDDKRWLLNAVESRPHGHYMNEVVDMETN